MTSSFNRRLLFSSLISMVMASTIWPFGVYPLPSTEILEDATTVYTIQHGQPQVLTVKDRSKLGTIRDQLCVDAKKSEIVCPSKKAISREMRNRTSINWLPVAD